MGDTIPAWLDAWSRFAASARLEDIDAATRERAKLTLADTLGAIAAGQQEPEIAALATRLAAQGGAVVNEVDRQDAINVVVARTELSEAQAAQLVDNWLRTANEVRARVGTTTQQVGSAG